MFTIPCYSIAHAAPTDATIAVVNTNTGEVFGCCAEHPQSPTECGSGYVILPLGGPLHVDPS